VTGNPLLCDFANVGGRMVTARISNADIDGAVLRVPEDYVRSIAFVDGGERGTLLMKVYPYSFMPYTRADAMLPDGRSKISQGIHDSMSILIGSYWPMPILAARTMAIHYDVDIRNLAAADLEGVKQSNGLYRPRHKHRYRWDDVFLGKTDGRITDVIACSRLEGGIKSPGCGHIFEAGRFDVDLSYPRSRLDDWRALRDRTDKFLNCITVVQPVELPDNEPPK
jgi:hypothetical protein